MDLNVFYYNFISDYIISFYPKCNYNNTIYFRQLIEALFNRRIKTLLQENVKHVVRTYNLRVLIISEPRLSNVVTIRKTIK